MVLNRNNATNFLVINAQNAFDHSEFDVQITFPLFEYFNLFSTHCLESIFAFKGLKKSIESCIGVSFYVCEYYVHEYFILLNGNNCKHECV